MPEEAPITLSAEEFGALEGAERTSPCPWVVTWEAAASFYQLVYGTATPPEEGVSPCILLHNVQGGKIVEFRFPPHNSRVRGENELEVIRPLRIGDEIRARTRVNSVQAKMGRSGLMVVVRGDTEYLDSGGLPVMVSRAALIFR